jgi:hypothetical protein
MGGDGGGKIIPLPTKAIEGERFYYAFCKIFEK